ncbi:MULTISPECIES: NAD-dependent epimerase/dehydratase family protein [Bacillales]|uniref:NAD-dependent epimerase/dehydratase family protein n=1 Tax=Bacillales TaxID=1385 RepID=UPI000345AB62|nr:MULTISPECIES: NAD-dependent epimerase/dehydratase family protein [Bacillales]KMZ42996.1 nucleoside-diphosphate sugar epimerase [Bacillus sp. FJAT-27238]
MKVLITGGYGFIGSFVAERFYKEGYKVFILDNLSSGNQRNITFPHKAYELDVADKKCDEVFKSNKFDVVIHLAAQVSVAASMEDPLLDTNTNILGLVNMLKLSSKYGVSKFIFASSAAVYGMNECTPLLEDSACDPVSVYGINKHIGEMYCRKWSEMYGLQTVAFRLANVYGPRQSAGGEGGVISTFLTQINHGKEIVVHGDGSQTRDFIYVEDVADAIFRSVTTDDTGVMNLSTNQESSINELIDILGANQPLQGISRREKRPGDVDKSVLDNTWAKRRLDWIPMYSLAEGLEKTAQWYQETGAEKEQEQESEAKKAIHWLRSWDARPYIENILAFLLVVFATVGTVNSGVFDLKLIYIVLIGAIYGTKQSLLSVILACGLFIGESLHNGRDVVSLLYDANVLFHIAVYFIIGIAVGYSIDKRNRDVLSKELQKQALEDKYDFLKDIYNDVLMVKQELQQQIVNSEDSFGKIYNITKELDSLEPERVLQKSVKVLERIMKSDEIAIYTMNQNGSFLRLMAKSNKAGFDLPRSLKMSEHAYLTELMTMKKIIVNKELRHDMPLIAAPIFDKGKMVAVVTLQQLGFENFTMYTQNLFQVAVQLISSALSRSLRYLNSTQRDRYLDDTPILIPAYFSAMVKNKRDAKQQLNTDFTLLAVDFAQMDHHTLATYIASSLREADYMGMDEAGDVYIILSNSNEQEARIVIDRLGRLGIASRIVQEKDQDRFSLKDGAYV